jgi:signal recognition particle subunit SRP54
MTNDERENPDIINGSRKNRIATGSGTSVTQVNQLLKQFSDMRKMMKTMNKMGGGKRALSALNPFGK